MLTPVFFLELIVLGVSRCFAIRFRLTIAPLLLLGMFHRIGIAEEPAIGRSSDATYVGSASCVNCHPAEHASYRKTTHSQAAAWSTSLSEPHTGSFAHSPSSARYEAFHRDGSLYHRETRIGPNGSELDQTEKKVELTLGSGTHGKSYVARSDSHWIQSPISWFDNSQRWDMSPGYDLPIHPSFQRKLDSSCFYCHVGMIDPLEGNPYQFNVVEVTIGCERCHGPGSTHVDQYRESPGLKDAETLIANPRELSRELSEAICQQCHMQGIAESLVTGKSEWDFRPGNPLTNYRIDFLQRADDDAMKIVGHVEQMHASECYKQSETLTCVTCHDPHDPVEPARAVEAYRQICLQCHDDSSCGQSRDERLRLVNNDCAHCHMPALETNVPHTAFRHHRIGVHTTTTSNKVTAVAPLSLELVPIVEPSGLPEWERRRTLALAQVQILREQPGNQAFAPFSLEAAKKLISLKSEGHDDAVLNAELAWLANDQGQKQISVMLAKEVRLKEGTPTRARIEATRLLAVAAFEAEEHATAVKLYRELNEYTRDALDSYSLGLSEQNVGNSDAAIAALKRSLELNPHQDAAHFALAAIYQSTARPLVAQRHRQLAEENQSRTTRLIEQATQPGE